MIYIIVGIVILYNKQKTQAGIKGNTFSHYIKDYDNYKTYWGAVGLIFIGLTGLISIFVLELVF